MSATQPASLGKYEIRGLLGRGAMGTVYDGWDPVIDRRVAIKTVRLPDAQDEEAVESLARFKREAQAAGRLTHPNIVGVYDYGETADLAYIVMEFVEGRSLKDVLAAAERMSAADAALLMEDVLAGLTFSHSRGVVHRDIKPANIMLTRENQAKIADFGIARIEASSMTQAGTVMGTPAYMSPEQFMGQVVDSRTDIYSCGVMLYQLLTGDRPFDGSMTAIMHKAMTTTPPKPSDLAVTCPASLDGVVARAMARRPEDRFGSAAEFDQALRQAAGGDVPATDETMMASPAQPNRAAPRPAPMQQAAPMRQAAPGAAARRGGKGLLLGGGAVAAVAVSAVAAWLLLTPPGHPPSPSPSQQASLTPVVPPTGLPRPALPPAPPIVVIPPAVQPQVKPDSAPASAPTPALAPASPPTSEPARQTTTATVTAQGAMTQGVPPAVATPPAPPAVAIPPMVPNPSPTAASPVMRPAAAVFTALASSLPAIRCSLTRATIGPDGTVVLAGVSGRGQPEADLRRAAAVADPAGLASSIETFDGPYCPALDVLRPFAEPIGPNRNAMDLVQAGGRASLRDNEVIALRVTMPGFAGYLHVAYLQHDATVSPQVPGPGYPAQTYPAREQIELGKPRADFEGWHVGPPFGTDMIVAVASTAPLFARPLPDSQSLASYLSSLQTAVEALRRRGGSAATAALVLDTRAGP